VRGWRPTALWNDSLLTFQATDKSDYMEIGYSKAMKLSRTVVSLTGGNFGFSKLGTATATFALGKNDGLYSSKKSKFYEDLLDDARQIHVVLQNTGDRCAWQTDAETIILHVVLHRHALKKFTVDGKVVNISAAEAQVPGSVRCAMLRNADTVVMRGRHMETTAVTDKLFKDIVGELFTMIEGLQANAEKVAETGIQLKLDWTRRVQGWEYMDLVQKKLKLELREIELGKTCGYWHKFAHDINAVVLFGTGFREVFQPKDTSKLCQAFRKAPKDKHYLVVGISTLRTLYWENNSSTDQTRLTSTGIRWQRAAHVFEPCPQANKNTKGSCTCERIQEFTPPRALGKVRSPGRLEGDGAVIFGKGNTSWMGGVTEAWSNVRNAFHQPDDEAYPHTLLSGAQINNTSKAQHALTMAPSTSPSYGTVSMLGPLPTVRLSLDNLEKLYGRPQNPSLPKRPEGMSLSGTETSSRSLRRTPSVNQKTSRANYADVAARSRVFEKRPQSGQNIDPMSTSARPSLRGSNTIDDLPTTYNAHTALIAPRGSPIRSKVVPQTCHTPQPAPREMDFSSQRNRTRGSNRRTYRQRGSNDRINSSRTHHSVMPAVRNTGQPNLTLRRRPSFALERDEEKSEKISSTVTYQPCDPP
jgi:hypothetical protein